MDPPRDLKLTTKETKVVLGKGKEKIGDRLEGSLTLVGMLLTDRPFNSYALQTTMKAAWRCKKSVHSRVIMKNLLSFQFKERSDLIRVLNGGPWSFDKALLLLREPGLEQPSKMKFEKATFWVRVYDVPLMALTSEMDADLGQSFGDLVEVDENAIKSGESYLRFRVTINVTEPLRRGVLYELQDKVFWSEAKYERLPNFCYQCGRLGHVDSDCEDTTKEQEGKEYGDWMRVSALRKDKNREESPTIEEKVAPAPKPPTSENDKSDMSSTEEVSLLSFLEKLNSAEDGAEQQESTENIQQLVKLSESVTITKGNGNKQEPNIRMDSEGNEDETKKGPEDFGGKRKRGGEGRDEIEDESAVGKKFKLGEASVTAKISARSAGGDLDRTQ